MTGPKQNFFPDSNCERGTQGHFGRLVVEVYLLYWSWGETLQDEKLKRQFYVKKYINMSLMGENLKILKLIFTMFTAYEKKNCTHQKLYFLLDFTNRSFDGIWFCWLVFIKKKQFFRQKVCLNDRVSSKIKMLLTHPRNEIENFWNKICRWFSSANNPSKWLNGPRDFGKKLLSILENAAFTLSEFLDVKFHIQRRIFAAKPLEIFYNINLFLVPWILQNIQWN